VIIVDRALAERERAGKPVRVGMIGAGFMGRGIANQIVNSVPGMELSAIANRTVERAEKAFLDAGTRAPMRVDKVEELESAMAGGHPAVTDDPSLLCRAEGIDALIEVTGTIGFAAAIVLEAMANGKHVVLMNAELDGTVGPILQIHAQRAGVVLTGSDGDQPGVLMNLYRFVRGIGLTPLLCGNIKGLHDPYRNPTTQAGFAARWGQNPSMVTSFADGTKISFEQAVVANATDMRVAKRGMLGYQHEGHVDELTERFDVDELRELGGIVDYVVGAQPSPGVFVLGTHDDPQQRHYLELYKLGSGPLYSFYTPYHLCHFEAPLSVARAVLFSDAALQPRGGPRVDVVATAKTDLPAGTVLDGLGEYTTYGLCENHETTAEEGLLPIGLAEGCRLRRSVAKDEVLRYADVEVPSGRLEDRLRDEQARHFSQVDASETAGRAL